MYTLYFNRRLKEVKVKKANKGNLKFPYSENVTKYNDCYYTCLTRKPLVEKANEIINDWINEINEELKIIESIKI